jgi:DNA recombination protein RmuC
MIPITDSTIAIAAALATAIMAAFLISLWLAIAGRRALSHTQELLRRCENELAESRTEQRGVSVALEQTQGQLQAKLEELASLKAELASSSARLNSAQQALTQLETQRLEREDRHLAQIALLNETRENLKKEFENLANRIFED